MPTSIEATVEPILVIEPRGRLALAHPRELWAFRDLLRSFAGRDLRLRYRQTLLGVAWVVLQPLLAAGIFSFVFGRIAHLTSEGVPYVVFSYAGLAAWTFFSSTLTRSATSLVSNAGMVSKVYFPRMLLPLSTLASALIDLAVALVMFVVLLVVYGVNPGWRLLALPAWLLILMFMAAGFGLIITSLAVRFRDVQFILPIATQLLLYASPVAYALRAVPQSARTWFQVNPLTGVLEAFRWSLLGAHTQLPKAAVAWSATAAVCVFFLGTLVFTSLERDFADVI